METLYLMESETNTQLISVALVDAQPLMRDALRALLSKNPRMRIVCEAGEADPAVTAVQHARPDIVIIDPDLPGKSGYDVLPALKHTPLTRTVVFTVHDDLHRAKRAILLGASGYILKTAGAADFIKALEEITSGFVYLPPQLEHARSAHITVDNGSALQLDPLCDLSRREREVFHLLADGMPNRIIAKKLFISPRTVETHRARVIKKMGFASTADLIRYAVKNHLAGI